MSPEDHSVSVIIPTQNRREDLKRTLDQLRGLGFPESRVHVYVNGCRDGTVEMLHKTYPDVQVLVSEKNEGASHARNELIQCCNTEYVVGLDSDSWPLSLDFPRIVHKSFAARSDVGLLAGCVHDAEYPSGVASPGAEGFEVRNFVGCGFALRRGPFLETGGFQSCFLYGHEESELALRMHARGWKAWFAPEFRVHHARSSAARANLFNEREVLCNALSSAMLNEPICLCLAHLCAITAHGMGHYIRMSQPSVPLLAWGRFLRRLPILLHRRQALPYEVLRAWHNLPGCPPQTKGRSPRIS